MRVSAIQLEWFRGAADPVSLEPDRKSMVVYGVNASGKSSFVDAIEYALEGRIGHLAHEYSGKHQERAVPNTHIPTGREAAVCITFADGTNLKVAIQRNGVATRSGDATAAGAWDYRRTVLRQDEVARFIHDTKGDKYSALLPLLGLQRLEMAAENLRQLSKTVKKDAKVVESAERLKQIDAKRKKTFGADDDAQILARIQALHGKYCAASSTALDPLTRCRELLAALDSRAASSSADQRRYVLLKEVSGLDLRRHVDAVRSANAGLASGVEPLIAERLEVLDSSAGFAAKLPEHGAMTCPACGRPIQVGDFRAHLAAEQGRLQEIIGLFEARKATLGKLSDSVTALRSSLARSELESWRDGIAQGPLAPNLTALGGMAPDKLRTGCEESDLEAVEELLPLVRAALQASEHAPPEVQELAADRDVVESAIAVIEAQDAIAVQERSTALISFIDALEASIREQIRHRSRTVVEEISSDVQVMWAVLHPGEAIEGVRLYLPEDADKAIDIGLQFHGIEQESPRLTLSEGHRNSLGLCIFLAMAKREAGEDRPIFLDDVVVSLDRNHRGMILELMEKEFGGRQVVLLTHDREWYTELRQQVDDRKWVFKALLPYETPALGIRWSHKTTTFGDARAQLADRPDSAGNDARKIMDVELALLAERLQVRMPYVRAERNDRRMAHDFLAQLAATGKRCFEVRTKDGYQPHAAAITAIEEADKLLVTWGNRASHTFDVARGEGAKLIDACEAALDAFRCSSCRKNVTFAEASGPELLQCECGLIRWKYGKG